MQLKLFMPNIILKKIEMFYRCVKRYTKIGLKREGKKQRIQEAMGFKIREYLSATSIVAPVSIIQPYAPIVIVIIAVGVIV